MIKILLDFSLHQSLESQDVRTAALIQIGEELLPGMFVSNVKHSSPRVSSGIRAQSASSGQIPSTKKFRQEDCTASHSDLQGLK